LHPRLLIEVALRASGVLVRRVLVTRDWLYALALVVIRRYDVLITMATVEVWPEDMATCTQLYARH
jgi:hypothetical protein